VNLTQGTHQQHVVVISHAIVCNLQQLVQQAACSACICAAASALHIPAWLLQAAPPGSAAAAQSISGQPTAVPVTLLLVDTSGPDEFLELVRAGLSLGLDALPPDSLVGLLGVSDCITLVDMAGE
jgi:hypothetical protein